MARYIGPKCKLSRREGTDLFLKSGVRSLDEKCNAETIPGQHGNRRSRLSDYGVQLREKQKVKRLYGLLERQFSKLMKEASRTSGQSGKTLLQLLEQRADNVIYRAGFAPSRRAARQLVTHGHFTLNGRRFDIPSQRILPTDELVVREQSKKTDYFKRLDEVSPSPESTVSWLKVNRSKIQVTMVALPVREEAEPDINEQLIVEYYSR